MKELEHVLQRVRIRGQDGIERKLKESIYAVMRVLADATLKNHPELGCQMSIEEMCKRSRKERSTVLAALAGAKRLGLITRHDPGTGARYATVINLINIRLVEASQKSRPYLGPNLIFDEPLTPSKTPPKNADLGASKMKEMQQIQASQEILGVQNLEVQILDGEHVFNTPPAPDVLDVGSASSFEEGSGAASLPLGVGIASSLPSSCPVGAGGCGSVVLKESNDLKDSTFKEASLLTESNFLELRLFSDFFERNKVCEVKTQCQRRKKDGVRGGVFFKANPQNFDELKYQIVRAATQKFEITTTCQQVLLIDDLDFEGVTEFLSEGFECAVIETSSNNFQALLATAPGWSIDQIRATQRALAARFGGDGNACAAAQLHRLPGSLNLKNGECFVTRLHTVQSGRLIEPSQVEIAAQPGQQSGHAQHRSDSVRDITPSGFDFGRAIELVKKGLPDSAIEAEILYRAQKRGRHGDHKDYASRTVRTARLQLAS